MRTIVESGSQAFQLPRSMVHARTVEPLDGRSLRLLYWLLWEAHDRGRWPRQDDDPSAMMVRYCANEMRAGAGLDSDNSYRGVREALDRLASARIHGVGETEWGTGHLVAGFTELPGPHFQIVFPSLLAAANWQPLSRYALVNMGHIRALRRPLDFAIYLRACEVARARHPQFQLGLEEIANISGSEQEVSWSALRRPFLGACERVTAAAGGRLLIQAWCRGDYHGVDSFMIHVGVHGHAMNERFPARHRAHYYEVDANGSRRYQPGKQRGIVG